MQIRHFSHLKIISSPYGPCCFKFQPNDTTCHWPVVLFHFLWLQQPRSCLKAKEVSEFPRAGSSPGWVGALGPCTLILDLQTGTRQSLFLGSERREFGKRDDLVLTHHWRGLSKGHLMLDQGQQGESHAGVLTPPPTHFPTNILQIPAD